MLFLLFILGGILSMCAAGSFALASRMVLRFAHSNQAQDFYLMFMCIMAWIIFGSLTYAVYIINFVKL